MNKIWNIAKHFVFGIIVSLLILFGTWIESSKHSSHNVAHFNDGELIATSRTYFDIQYFKDGVEVDSLPTDVMHQLEYDINVYHNLSITGRKCVGYWLWYKGTLVDSLIWYQTKRKESYD